MKNPGGTQVTAAAAAKFVPSFLVVVVVLNSAEVMVDVTVVTDVKKKVRCSPPVNKSSMGSFWEDTISGVASVDCSSAKALTSTLFKGRRICYATESSGFKSAMEDTQRKQVFGSYGTTWVGATGSWESAASRSLNSANSRFLRHVDKAAAASLIRA